MPASYGTTGLVVRTDLVGNGLKRWADLWDGQYAGKIGLRAQPREIIGMTLTSLGCPFASENPRDLEVVLQRLLALKPSVVMLNIETDEAVEKLLLRSRPRNWYCTIGWMTSPNQCSTPSPESMVPRSTM